MVPTFSTFQQNDGTSNRRTPSSDSAHVMTCCNWLSAFQTGRTCVDPHYNPKDQVQWAKEEPRDVKEDRVLLVTHLDLYQDHIPLCYPPFKVLIDILSEHADVQYAETPRQLFVSKLPQGYHNLALFPISDEIADGICVYDHERDHTDFGDDG
ncbi:hypothetical protein JOM56_001815 [Amanita muscaria]